MNKQFLKIIRDNIPGYLKVKAGIYFRNALIKNKEFVRYSELLEKRENQSIEKINRYQFEKLKDVLIHSYNNVPYYHDLFDQVSFNPHKFSDFGQMSDIPFLTREIVRDNFDRLRSRKKIKNGYYAGTTGGSSGIPLKLLLDYDSIGRESAFIYHYRKKLGYKLDGKLVTFRQASEFSSRLWEYNPMHNEIVFLPMKISRLTINEYAKKINEFQPDYLNGYLSSIWYFAKLLDEFKIKLNINIKGIFLTSENLDPRQREFIENFFGVKSMTFYGHSERCVMAEEVDPAKYKFDPHYGYAELILSEANRYSIVGTGFLNYTMPFIRYRTDDSCSPLEKHYVIEGKRSSTLGLVGINDEFLPSTAFDLENPVFRHILTYQLIQEEKGKADLLLIPGSNFKKAELEHIKNEINKATKGIIVIDVKLVDNLVLSNRGKFQMYVSKVKTD